MAGEYTKNAQYLLQTLKQMHERSLEPPVPSKPKLPRHGRARRTCVLGRWQPADSPLAASLSAREPTFAKGCSWPSTKVRLDIASGGDAAPSSQRAHERRLSIASQPLGPGGWPAPHDPNRPDALLQSGRPAGHRSCGLTTMKRTFVVSLTRPRAVLPDRSQNPPAAHRRKSVFGREWLPVRSALPGGIRPCLRCVE